jgi:hypothetical protein
MSSLSEDMKKQISDFISQSVSEASTRARAEMQDQLQLMSNELTAKFNGTDGQIHHTQKVVQALHDGVVEKLNGPSDLLESLKADNLQRPTQPLPNPMQHKHDALLAQTAAHMRSDPNYQGPIRLQGSGWNPNPVQNTSVPTPPMPNMETGNQLPVAEETPVVNNVKMTENRKGGAQVLPNRPKIAEAAVVGNIGSPLAKEHVAALQSPNQPAASQQQEVAQVASQQPILQQPTTQQSLAPQLAHGQQQRLREQQDAPHVAAQQPPVMPPMYQFGAGTPSTFALTGPRQLGFRPRLDPRKIPRPPAPNKRNKMG